MGKRRPKFTRVVQSVDTPLKDKQVNDMVAIQAWGVKGADRYLLELRKGHMSKGQAYRAILEQGNHVRKLFPHAIHTVLIEPDEARLSVLWRGCAPALRPYMPKELETMPFRVEW